MLSSLNAISQVTWDVVVNGAVYKGNKTLEGAVVTLYENSVEVDEIKTPEDGVFNFILFPGNDYLITAAKPGYVSKRVSITTKELPKEATRVAFLPWISFDINLFEEIKGLDVSILDKPVSKYVYDKKKDAFIHDPVYTKSIQVEAEKFVKAFEQKQQEIYDALITKAGNAFVAEDFTTAKNAYLEAMEIKPGEKNLKEKIEEIDRILISVREEKYKTSIVKADSCFNAKNYQNAKDAYLEAIAYKPDVAYPKQKIKDIDAILAAIKEKKYNAFITEADNAFNVKDYQNAKNAYQQAITTKPDEIYPRNKMKEIYKILVTISATEAEPTAKERYNTFIDEADMAFDAKDYQRAKHLYEEALAIKLNKKLKTRINEINNILEAMRTEEKTKVNTKAGKKPASEEERYITTIAEADKALAEHNYYFAKIMYQSALAVKPDDKHNQDKIKEIEIILAAGESEEDRKSREENTKAMADAIEMSKSTSEKQTAETRIKAEEAKRDKKAIEDLLAEDEEKKLFLYELAKKYPEGVTKETILEEKRQIIRIIIVKDDTANEYKKTIYDWGGIYYEKNGEDISKNAFETETGKPGK